MTKVIHDKLMTKIDNILSTIKDKDIHIKYLDHDPDLEKQWGYAYTQFLEPSSDRSKRLEYLRNELLIHQLATDKSYFRDNFLSRINYIFFIKEFNNRIFIKFKFHNIDSIQLFFSYNFTDVNTDRPKLFVEFSKSYPNIE